LSVSDDINKGIRAKGKYRGCVRNLVIDDKLQYFASGVIFSDVRVDGCPTD